MDRSTPPVGIQISGLSPDAVSYTHLVIAYGAVVFDGEPAYDAIDGQWLTDEPYVLVHRIAVVDGERGRGVAAEFLHRVETLAQERGCLLYTSGTGCFVKQGGNVPHQKRISRVRFYLFGTAGIIPVTRYDRRQSIELHGVNAFYKGRAKTVVNG